MKKAELRKEINKLRSDRDRISYVLQQEHASTEISRQILSHAIQMIADRDDAVAALNDIIDTLVNRSCVNVNENGESEWHEEHAYLACTVMDSLENLLHAVGHHVRLHRVSTDAEDTQPA